MWFWDKSNGKATDIQMRNAYRAITNQGLTLSFDRQVWNDIVNNVYNERQIWAGGGLTPWKPSYLSLEDTLMHDDSILTADKFNSVVSNIPTISNPKWEERLGRPYIVSGDICYGEYFIWLTEYLNKWLTAETMDFNALIALNQLNINSEMTKDISLLEGIAKFKHNLFVDALCGNLLVNGYIHNRHVLSGLLSGGTDVITSIINKHNIDVLLDVPSSILVAITNSHNLIAYINPNTPSLDALIKNPHNLYGILNFGDLIYFESLKLLFKDFLMLQTLDGYRFWINSNIAMNENIHIKSVPENRFYINEREVLRDAISISCNKISDMLCSGAWKVKDKNTIESIQGIQSFFNEKFSHEFISVYDIIAPMPIWAESQIKSINEFMFHISDAERYKFLQKYITKEFMSIYTLKCIPITFFENVASSIFGGFSQSSVNKIAIENKLNFIPFTTINCSEIFGLIFSDIYKIGEVGILNAQSGYGYVVKELINHKENFSVSLSKMLNICLYDEIQTDDHMTINTDDISMLDAQIHQKHELEVSINKCRYRLVSEVEEEFELISESDDMLIDEIEIKIE